MTTTTKPETKVSQGRSEYGNAQPTARISFPRGTSYRVVSAATFRLAAAIEEASEGECWCVGVEPGNEYGRVWLDLADATPAEAKRAMAVLRAVVGGAK